MAANPEMREIERRKLNITEGLILAALVGLATLIFRLNDSVTRLQVAAESTNRQLAALQMQLADVPALAQRVSRLEVQMDATKDQVKELQGMKGLK
jgi:hypothetical protein